MARLDNELIDRYRTIKKSSLDKNKTLVIVIDMVKGFCELGPMSDPAISHLVSEILPLLKYYKNHLYFLDAHQPDSTELEIFPQHCLKGTIEAELVDALKEDAMISTVIEKNSTNGFMAPLFMNHAKDTAERFDNFILVGCCTDICVLQFALSWMGYLQQNNYKNKMVCMPLNVVDTYHINGQHDAKTFNRMAVHLLENAGIKILKKIS